METDPASLDPEERQNKFFALLSAALGLLSLCAAMIPACGAAVSLAGIALGWLGARSGNKKIALAGITFSSLGLLISIVYALFVYVAGTADMP